jgi:hypothetical protein
VDSEKILEEEQLLWIAIRTILGSVATPTALTHINAIYKKLFMEEH